MTLAHRDEVELAELLGIDIDSAWRLAMALELHQRLNQWSVPHRPILNDPAVVIDVMAPLRTLPEEHFWCLPITRTRRLIGSPIEISMGDVDGCDAGPRAFYRAALLRGAVKAIAVHNHPSCEPTPSAEDRFATSRLVTAGRALQITLVDHIIITPDRSLWRSLQRDDPRLF